VAWRDPQQRNTCTTRVGTWEGCSRLPEVVLYPYNLQNCPLLGPSPTHSYPCGWSCRPPTTPICRAQHCTPTHPLPPSPGPTHHALEASAAPAATPPAANKALPHTQPGTLRFCTWQPLQAPGLCGPITRRPLLFWPTATHGTYSAGGGQVPRCCCCNLGGPAELCDIPASGLRTTGAGAPSAPGAHTATAATAPTHW
jgi:hypothetical protein